MPTDVGFWIVVVVAVAAVIALAIWAGNNVVLKFKSFTFQTTDKNDRPLPASDVKVAEEADLGGNVGRVIGKSLGNDESQGGNIEVAKRIKIGGNVDEIIGVETGRKKHDTQ